VSVPAAERRAAKVGPTRAEKALETFHEEGAIGKGVRHASFCGALWPFVHPHSAPLHLRVARHARRHLVHQSGEAASDGRCRAPGGILRDSQTSLPGTARPLALLLVITQALTFVQMYTMQVAGGARAMADSTQRGFSNSSSASALRYYDKTPVRGASSREPRTTSDALSELFASGALNAHGRSHRARGGSSS